MNFLQSSIGGDDVLKYHTDHFFSACFFFVCLDSQAGLWRKLIRLSTSMHIKQQLCGFRAKKSLTEHCRSICSFPFAGGRSEEFPEVVGKYYLSVKQRALKQL